MFVKENLGVSTKCSRFHSNGNVITSEVFQLIWIIDETSYRKPQVATPNELNGIGFDKDCEDGGIADRDLVSTSPLHPLLL